MKDDRKLQGMIESRMMDAKKAEKVRMEEDSKKKRLERVAILKKDLADRFENQMDWLEIDMVDEMMECEEEI